MPFTPLTEEQYNKALNSGFSEDEILNFEKQRKQESIGTNIDKGRNVKNIPESEFNKNVGTEFINNMKNTTLGDVAKAAINPISKSVSGKSLLERSQETTPQGLIPVTGNPVIDAIGNTERFVEGGVRDAAASAADISPASMGLAATAMTKPVIQAGQAIAGSKIGQGVGKIFSAEIKPIEKLQNAFKNTSNTINNVQNKVKFAKSVRNDLFAKKTDMGKNFNTGIKSLEDANPNVTGDFVDEFSYLKQALEDSQNNPGLASQIKGIIRKVKNPEDAKLIQGLIDNPESAGQLKLSQVQTIKNAIQQSPSIATKLKQGKFANWNEADIELLDLLDNIKVKQTDMFPEMAQVRAPYANYMQNYNAVKTMFKPGRLINKLKDGFGDQEIEAMVKVALPEKTFGDIKSFRRALHTIKITGGLLLGGAGAYGSAKIYNAIKH